VSLRTIIEMAFNDGLKLLTRLSQDTQKKIAPVVYTYFRNEVSTHEQVDMILSVCQEWGAIDRGSVPVYKGTDLRTLVWLLTRQPEIWPRPLTWYQDRAKFLHNNGLLDEDTYLWLIDRYDEAESKSINYDIVVPVCGNSKCVNPEHLTLLTPLQSVLFTRAKQSVKRRYTEFLNMYYSSEVYELYGRGYSANSVRAKLPRLRGKTDKQLADMYKKGKAWYESGMTSSILAEAYNDHIPKISPGLWKYCDNYIAPPSFEAMLDRIYFCASDGLEELPIVYERGIASLLGLILHKRIKEAQDGFKEMLALYELETSDEAELFRVSPFAVGMEQVEVLPKGGTYLLQVKKLKQIADDISKKYKVRVKTVASFFYDRVQDALTAMESVEEPVRLTMLERGVVRRKVEADLTKFKEKVEKTKEERSGSPARIKDILAKAAVEDVEKARVVTSSEVKQISPRPLHVPEMDEKAKLELEFIEKARKEAEKIRQQLAEEKELQEEEDSLVFEEVDVDKAVEYLANSGPLTRANLARVIWSSSPMNSHIDGTASIPVTGAQIQTIERIYEFLYEFTEAVNKGYQECCMRKADLLALAERAKSIKKPMSQVKRDKKFQEVYKEILKRPFVFDFLPSWHNNVDPIFWQVEALDKSCRDWVARHVNDDDDSAVSNLTPELIESLFNTTWDKLDKKQALDTIDKHLTQHLNMLEKNIAVEE
jgi:hypothetical protein